jgi:hypothetical protein
MRIDDMLLQKMNNIELLLQRIIGEKVSESVMEFSLSRTAKLLHRSTDTIKQMVEDGQIRASKEIINGRVEIRFTLADIRQYQRNKIYVAD